MEADRWARIERELLEQSTRRIHEFERRLEHEWEALRQLHEQPLKALPRTERRVRAALLALAIAIASAVAINTFLYFRLSARIAAAERVAREAQEATRTETGTALREMRTLSAQTQAAVRTSERMLNVLVAADVQTFALAGGPRAAAAGGQALWSRSRGLVLEASRVPRPAAAEAQQVWLMTTRGALSLGFVTPDAQGRLTAAFDTPPELPGQVVGVAVTAEAVGGSAAPGSRVVLASR